MKKLFSILLMFALVTSIEANNIKVEDVKYDKATKKVSFKLSWENAWRQTTEFHDAAWVFCKYKTVNSGKWGSVNLKANSTKANGVLETIEPKDLTGFFVRFNTDSIGLIAPTEVSFQIDSIYGVFPDFKVFAIEMVYVPKGEFYAGTSQNHYNSLFNEFYMKNVNYPIKYPIQIQSEAEIKSNSTYQFGGINGTIPAKFPKGFDAFYCMKHEISNAQFVDFLNSIDEFYLNKLGIRFAKNKQLFVYSDSTVPSNKAQTRESIVSYYDDLNGVTFYCDNNENKTPNDSTDGMYLPAILFPTWIVNYLSWSGLAPMTEFQFEKACRGPMYPIVDELASGRNVSTVMYYNEILDMNTENERLSRKVINPTPILPMRCGFAADSSTNRAQSNATYYGILDMGGNLSEFCIAADSANVNYIFTTKSDYFIGGLEGRKYIYRGANYLNNNYKGISLRTSGFETITNNPREVFDGYFSGALGGRGVRKPD